ncbi:Uncharacterised protein [Vibrio cholerae]|nr:Uncharacterised protein [Vibrio cholerae]CSI91300.1 Uncharacterised protein [Vibrio cholerae]
MYIIFAHLSLAMRQTILILVEHTHLNRFKRKVKNESSNSRCIWLDW